MLTFAQPLHCGAKRIFHHRSAVSMHLFWDIRTLPSFWVFHSWPRIHSSSPSRRPLRCSCFCSEERGVRRLPGGRMSGIQESGLYRSLQKQLTLRSLRCHCFIPALTETRDVNITKFSFFMCSNCPSLKYQIFVASLINKGTTVFCFLLGNKHILILASILSGLKLLHIWYKLYDVTQIYIISTFPKTYGKQLTQPCPCQTSLTEERASHFSDSSVSFRLQWERLWYKHKM